MLPMEACVRHAYRVISSDCKVNEFHGSGSLTLILELTIVYRRQEIIISGIFIQGR